MSFIIYNTGMFYHRMVKNTTHNLHCNWQPYRWCQNADWVLSAAFSTTLFADSVNFSFLKTVRLYHAKFF